MTAAGVGALVGAAGGPERYAEVAALLAIAVGIVCAVGFIGRLGFLTRLLSRPVLVGYLIGIAVLMIVSQLSKVTQVNVESGQTWQEIISFIKVAGQAHIPTVILAVVVLSLLYLANWLTPKFPSTLMVLLLSAAAVGFFHLDRFGLEVIGEVPLACLNQVFPRLAI